MQIFGGLEPVALHQRDRLIALLDADPDPEEVVAELSARFGPPVLQNTEGDPLVFCEAEVRVPDADGLRRWLDAAYDRSEDEDDAEVWLEHVVTHGLTRVRATLRLVGDRLHIDVNSEARLDRLLDAVRSEQPGAEVASEQRVPATDLQEVQRLPSADSFALRRRSTRPIPRSRKRSRRWSDSTRRPGWTSRSPPSGA
jgi:hypothetical protein